MGNGASTNVREIHINQNDENVRSSVPQSAARRSAGSASSLGKRFRRSNSSSADRRMQQLHNSLEAADKRASQAENRVRQLERDINQLEHRNSELSEEVKWLKQQMTERPEIPILPRPSSSSKEAPSKLEDPSVSSEYNYRKHFTALETELADLTTKYRKDTQRLKADLEDQTHDTEEQVAALKAQIVYAKKLNEQYESIIRENLSETDVTNAKSKADLQIENEKSKDSSTAYSRSLPKPAPKEHKDGSKEDSKPRTRVSPVEPIGKQATVVDNAPKISPVEAIGKQPSVEKDSHGALKGSILARPPSSGRSTPAFSARKVHSANAAGRQQPMRVSRKSEKVEDEIEALLKTQQEQPFANISDNFDGPDLFNQSTRSLPPLPNRMVRMESVPADEPCQRSRNVIYTMSDQLRPAKVMQTSSSPRHMDKRPKTADPVHFINREDTEIEYHQQINGERGGSAPMLFKSTADNATGVIPGPKVVQTNRQNAAKRGTTEEAQILSLSDVDDDDCEPDSDRKRANSETIEVPIRDPDLTVTPYRPSSGPGARPPQGSRPPSSISRFRASLSYANKKTESASSLNSSTGTGTEDDFSDDEEVKRILENRNLAQRPHTGSKHRQAPGSAKSRDSGFLGDSFSASQQAWKQKTLIENDLDTIESLEGSFERT